MMRVWLRWSVVLLTVSVVLIATSIGIGVLTLPHPALADFASCDGFPCWLGIDLKNDAPEQMLNSINERGYVSVDNINYLAPDESNLCDMLLGISVFDTDLRISSIQLLNCNDLKVGDLWTVLGTPTMIANDCFDNWVLWYDNTIAVIVNGALTPENTVSQIAFYNLSEFGMLPTGVRWHGFATQWRYNQLEDNIRGC